MTTSKQVPAAERPKPPAAGKGRKKGTPNKATKALKDAILLAAETVGQDGKGKDGLVGYCKRLAFDEPKAFSTLLGKVLPIQIAGDAANPIAHVHRIERVIVRAADRDG